MSPDAPPVLDPGAVEASHAAAFWLERLHGRHPAGGPGAGKAAFTRWLMTDAANRKAWDRALNIWVCFDFAGADDALEAMRLRALTGVSDRRNGLCKRWHRASYATSMAVVAGLWLPFHKVDNNLSAIITACRAGGAAILAERATLALGGQGAMDVASRADHWLLRVIRGLAWRDGIPRPFRLAAGEEDRTGQNFLQFNDEPLGTAVARLNRHARRVIVIRDARVAALRISGAFPARDTEGFVETLLLLYPLRVRHLPDGRIELLSRR